MKNPIATLRVVRVNAACPEESLETSATKEQIVEYIRTRDPEGLVFPPEYSAVVFEVLRLPQPFIADVLSGIHPYDARRLLAFRAAVHSVFKGKLDSAELASDSEGNLLVCKDKKASGKNAPYVSTDGDHGTDIAPLSFVQAIANQWGYDTIMELGQVAIDFAKLPEGKRGPFSLWVG
jgi:hypothetical protein